MAGRLAKVKQYAQVFYDYCHDAGYTHCPVCEKLLYWPQSETSTLTSRIASVDHFIPLSRGGSYKFVNLTLMCHICNNSKGSMTVDEWIVEQEKRNFPFDERALQYFAKLKERQAWLLKENVLLAPLLLSNSER